MEEQKLFCLVHYCYLHFQRQGFTAEKFSISLKSFLFEGLTVERFRGESSTIQGKRILRREK